MKLTFVESGGYAGLVRGVSLDTDELPRDEAQHLEALIENSGLLHHPSATGSAARDALQYELTIEDGPVRTRIVFDDTTKPPASIPLLRELRARSRVRRP